MLQSLINTLIYAVTTSGIYAQGFLRTVIFLPVLVSMIGVGLTFTALLHLTKGAMNVALAAIGLHGPGWLTNPDPVLFSVAFVDVYKGVGRATLIYFAGLASIRPDYYEAARTCGATRRQMFWRISVPLVRPATIIVITLTLIGGLRSFDWCQAVAAVLKGDPAADKAGNGAKYRRAIHCNL